MRVCVRQLHHPAKSASIIGRDLIGSAECPARKPQVRPKRTPKKPQPLKHDLINGAIRDLQLVQSVGICAARAGIHDLVAAHVLADAFSAIERMLEQSVAALDQSGVAP